MAVSILKFRISTILFINNIQGGLPHGDRLVSVSKNDKMVTKKSVTELSDCYFSQSLTQKYSHFLWFCAKKCIFATSFNLNQRIMNN